MLASPPSFERLHHFPVTRILHLLQCVPPPSTFYVVDSTSPFSSHFTCCLLRETNFTELLSGYFLPDTTACHCLVPFFVQHGAQHRAGIQWIFVGWREPSSPFVSGRNCVWQHEQKPDKCALASRGFIVAESLEVGSCSAQGCHEGPGLFEFIALPSLLCGFHPHSCKMLQHLILDRKKEKEHPPSFIFL